MENNENITENTEKKKKKKKGGILFWILIAVFACVAIFSAYKLIGIMLTYKHGRDMYSNIENNVIVVPDTSDLPGNPDDGDRKKTDYFQNVDFDALKEITDNAIGWIYCPNTHVNYPMVQGPDNDYYLRRAVDGSEFIYGSIFLDYRNAPDFSDQNTIIYGHQSNDGRMFEDVRKFKDQSYYDDHPFFYLTLEDGKYLMEIFSAYVTSSSSSAYKRTFNTDEDYQLWISKVISMSAVRTGVKPTTEDHIVTLSTCTYEYDNARFVLHGRLVKLEEE